MMMPLATILMSKWPFKAKILLSFISSYAITFYTIHSQEYPIFKFKYKTQFDPILVSLTVQLHIKGVGTRNEVRGMQSGEPNFTLQHIMIMLNHEVNKTWLRHQP